MNFYLKACLILAIIALGITSIYYAGEWLNKRGNFDKVVEYKDACYHLYKTDEHTAEEYPKLQEVRERVENQTGLKYSGGNIWGTYVGSSTVFNVTAINCQVKGKYCYPDQFEDGYCQELYLNVVIDYDDYLKWINN